MQPDTTIPLRDRESSMVLPAPNSNGKENKRPARAFGPVDLNSFHGGNDTASAKLPPLLLPKSPNPTIETPNPTLKKKPKAAAAIDPNRVGSSNSDPSDVEAILSASLKTMTIGNDPAVVDPAAQETAEIDWTPIQEELDALFVKQSKERMKGVPMIEMPEILTKNGVALFDHQKEGIRWLFHKEVTNTDIPPYYRLQKFGRSTTMRYVCSIDNRMCRDEDGPQPIRHSILADDMGLGKTLQSIGLILSNPPAGRNGIKAYPYKMPRKKEKAPPRCTIIVSPVSVMANWMTEIDKFVHKKKKNILKVEIYQGIKRIEVLRKVNEGKVDILICSYNTLASDLKKYRKMKSEKSQQEPSSNGNADGGADLLLNDGDPIIFDQEFHRIILDEAHMIRNARTRYFQSVNSLVATHKLCLTGTPFVNHPHDIHSFLDFLEVAPCNNIETFNTCVVQKIAERKEVGLARLRVLMSTIAIRRTKKEVENEIQLPSKSVQIRKVPFPDSCEHQQLNDMLYETCRTAFLALSKSGSTKFGGKVFRLLGMVLRIRQSCCDASLVPLQSCEAVASVWERFRDVDVDVLSQEEGMRLYDTLLDVLAASKMKIDNTEKENVVPAEDNDDDNDDGVDVDADVDVDDDVDDGFPKPSRFGRSPKVQALMDAIAEMEPDEKGVIFSQWTAFLNIIQRELELEGHSFGRIVGTMDATERYEALKNFETDSSGSPRFMLCSVRACNTGISLTRANHVFIMDTWWNVAEENQAMDRVHRIGQSRPVRAIRFIMKDSIEERFIEVQDAKMALAKGSMERLKKEDRRKASITALKDLFEMKTKAHVWEGTFVDDDAIDDGSDLGDFIVPDDHFE